ncbi:MAG: ribosome small subunit-dependent GTPase A [Acidaminococcaceae bacterium]
MNKEQGRIIKTYNGYYYVETADKTVFTCKIKGKMKQIRFSLCTGDYVEFEVTGGEGMITEIMPRKNFLQRPTVANVDLVIVAFACVNPDFSFILADKLLALAQMAHIPAVLCLNKLDLAPVGLVEKISTIYQQAGYQVYPISAQTQEGLEALRAAVSNQVTVFAGPSGVGKSSTLNALEPGLQLVTGGVSEKIGRGKHTTRFAHLLPFAGGYLVDTPGFGNLSLEEITLEQLYVAFKEFTEFAGACRFTTCTHTHEPGCAVKAALAEGVIATSRYESYLMIMQEIKTKKEKDGRK